MTDTATFCFLTRFVCRWGQLDEAKERHLQCVNTMRDRYGYTVHFCSEEVYDFGNNDLLFDLLIEEIVGHDTVLSDEEKDDYSVFGFFTVLDLPPSTASDPDIAEAYRTATVRLQIDFETGFPGKFPSRTSGIQVSATGDEQGSISDL